MADPKDSAAGRSATPTGLRFGSRLRAAMEGLGSPEGTPITVHDLYRAIENEPDLAMSRGHLYRLVEGTAMPRLHVLEALARFFNLPVSYFVDDDDYRTATLAEIDAFGADLDAMRARLSRLRVMLVRDSGRGDNADSDTSDAGPSGTGDAGRASHSA